MHMVFHGFLFFLSGLTYIFACSSSPFAELLDYERKGMEKKAREAI